MFLSFNCIGEAMKWLMHFIFEISFTIIDFWSNFYLFVDGGVFFLSKYLRVVAWSE